MSAAADQHPSDEVLRSFTEGKLDESALAEVERHLEGCATCCDTLASVKTDDIGARIRRLEAASGHDSVPDPIRLSSLRGLFAPPNGTAEWTDSVQDRERLDDFQIIREIGRGGMGVVFEAEQTSLARRVALKVLLHPSIADRKQRERFQREAEAVGRLHHPNIVHIYGNGECDGIPYLVMQFIEGVSLNSEDFRKELSKNPSGDEIERAVHLTQQIAAAVDHAHQQGVLHRDIKPGNLLVNSEGHAWLSDFGLAKLDDDQSLTKSGDVLGTLRYLSPEALGGTYDVRSEVYALGLTCYELIAGRPVFDHDTHRQLMHALANEGSPKLRSLVPNASKDLETVVHKAIAREPEARYATAGEFTADLQRILDGEPVRARQASSAELLWRWSKRNRALATSLATLLSVLVMVSIFSILAARRFKVLNVDLKDAVTAETAAHQLAEEEAGRNKDLADRNSLLAAENAEATESATSALFESQVAAGLSAGLNGQTAEALLMFADAAQYCPQQSHARQIHNIRMSTWRQETSLPIRHYELEGGPVMETQFQPHGDFLAAQTANGVAYLINWRTQKNIVPEALPYTANSMAWTASGSRCVVACRGHRLISIAPETGETEEVPRLKETAEAIGISPDERYYAFAGRTLRIWDTQSRKLLTMKWKHPEKVRGISFSPDGLRVATFCADARTRIFNRDGTEPDVTVTDRQRPGHRPIWTEDGSKLVTAGRDNAMLVVDSKTGKKPQRLPGRGLRRPFLYSNYSESTQRVAAATFYHLRIQSTSPGGRFLREYDIRGAKSLNLSSDEKFWMICGLKSVQFGSLAEKGNAPAPIHFHVTTECADLHDDDRHLAVAGWVGRLQVWELPNPSGFSDLTETPCQEGFVAPELSPSGDLMTRRLWRTSPVTQRTGPPPTTPQLTVFDVRSGTMFDTNFPSDTGVIDHEWISDDELAILDSKDSKTGRVSRWDFRQSKFVGEPILLPVTGRSLALHRGTDRIAILCSDGQIRFIDWTDEKNVSSIVASDQAVNLRRCRIEFTPDGTGLIALLPRNRVCVFDADSGAKKFELAADKIQAIDFRASPDGALLLTIESGENTGVRVWDLQSGKPLCSTLRHRGTDFGVFDARFSEDSKYVLTGSIDRQVRLWDWKNEKLLSPMQSDSEVKCAAFVAEQGIVAGGNGAGRIHFWDTETGLQVMPPIRMADTIGRLAVSVNGHMVAVGNGFTASIPAANLLPKGDVDLAEITLQAELASGKTIFRGQPVPLDHNAYSERWQLWTQRRDVRVNPKIDE